MSKKSNATKSKATAPAETKAPVSKEIKETAVTAPVAETVKKETTTKKETAVKKETAAKKETAPAAKKETATAAKTKEPAKTTKKVAKESCFVEFAGKQLSVTDITENAKKHWMSSNSGTISDIKVYVNTDNSKVYYVVNNEDRGEFDI